MVAQLFLIHCHIFCCYFMNFNTILYFFVIEAVAKQPTLVESNHNQTGIGKREGFLLLQCFTNQILELFNTELVTSIRLNCL